MQWQVGMISLIYSPEIQQQTGCYPSLPSFDCGPLNGNYRVPQYISIENVNKMRASAQFAISVQ
jgi:hypothetical protein